MRISLECFPVLIVEVALSAKAVTEELRQVSGAPVSLGPLEVLGIPCGGLLLLRVLLGWGLLTLDSLSLGCCLLNFLLLGLGNHGCVHGELGVLLFVAEGDAASDLANAFLDAEELVHETQLHALVRGTDLLRVHEAFKQNETLGCAAFGNFLLNELHNQVLIIVDGGVLTLREWVNILGDWAELDVLLTLRVDQSTTKFSLSTHFMFDQLIDREIE